MTDEELVERLRKYAKMKSMQTERPHMVEAMTGTADRFEALTAENEALKKSGRALLNAKHEEAAEAELWFEKGQALTVENELLRKALGAAPLISAQEDLAAFKSRQDEWLRTEYRAAHHPECEDATGAYPGSCTCAAIKRREAMEHVIHSSMSIDFERRYAMDDLIAQDADHIDVETGQ